MANEYILGLVPFEAAADLSTKQYYAVKLDASGQIALCDTAGEKCFGVLQDKPAAADRECSVAVSGVTKAVAGAAIAIGDPVGPNAAGKFVKVDEKDEACFGRAKTAAAADAVVFELLITHEGSAAVNADIEALVAAANYASAGQYCAVKLHTTAGQAIKCSVAGEHAIGILTNAPAASATALVKTSGVTTAKAGTAGWAAGDALAVEVTSGELVTATDGQYVVAYGLEAATDGQTKSVLLSQHATITVDGQTLANGKIWVGDGASDAAAVTPSGDLTMTNAGVATLAKGFIRPITTTHNAAAVIAANVTPLVLVDHSALVAAGTIAAGDALIFHGLVENLVGGTISYDQNENEIVRYQTAGGGAIISTTKANFCNGAAAGAMTTIKAITTDVAPEASQDLVLTFSASPFNAAGDRALAVTTYYSVYTPGV